MTESQPDQPRPLEWIGSSKKDLMALPGEVVDVFGYALYLAQTGEKHAQAKQKGSQSQVEVECTHLVSSSFSVLVLRLK